MVLFSGEMVLLKIHLMLIKCLIFAFKKIDFIVFIFFIVFLVNKKVN